jgi:hypothetical protein
MSLIKKKFHNRKNLDNQFDKIIILKRKINYQIYITNYFY